MKTKEFDKIKPYTYLVTRLSDNKKYHGVRWGNKVPPMKDLGVVYFTSSKKIKMNLNLIHQILRLNFVGLLTLLMKQDYMSKK